MRILIFMKKNSRVIKVIFVVVLLALIVGAVKFSVHCVKKGAEELANSYRSSYQSERENTYNAFYTSSFDAAEKEYHVSNRVVISIREVKETAKLEVLKVSDIEYIIEDSKDNNNNITAWLEVPGEAAFIVDLSVAEYIVDNEREYVLIRLPYPELTTVQIDYANINKHLFENDVFNESYSVGEKIAEKLLDKAALLIKKEFVSNETFYLNAQDSARSTIINLVKQLNPKVPDIMVEVEFY